MPEITKEQLAVLEAARSWRHNAGDGRTVALIAVIDALPKPYVPLVDDGMVNDIMAHDEPRSRRELVQEVVAEVLRKAAARLDEGEYADDADARRLREWADEEEKLAK